MSELREKVGARIKEQKLEECNALIGPEASGFVGDEICFLESLLPTIEQLEADKAELVGLCEAAGCPSCNGDGAYYDNHGEVCQCQWCYELAKHKGE